MYFPLLILPLRPKALAMPLTLPKFLLTASCCTLSLFAFSQESANAGGGDANSIDDGSVSFSIGQTVYTSDESTAGSSSMGVQQVYNVEIITNNAAAYDLSIDLNVFPNPAMDHVTLEIIGSLAPGLQYNLKDLNGVTLFENQINGASTTVPVDELSPATYMITVLSENTAVSSFRIIKL